MDLINLLTSFLSSDYGKSIFPPLLSAIFNLLKENSFDINKTLKNLDINSLAPVISKLFSEQNKSPTDFSVEPSYSIDPVSSFADKEVLSSLNSYLENSL